MEAVGENATEMDELEAYMDAIKRGKEVRLFWLICEIPFDYVLHILIWLSRS